MPVMGPVIVLTLTVAVAVVAHVILWRILMRAANTGSGVMQRGLRRSRIPVRLAFVFFALAVVLPASDFPPTWSAGLSHASLVILIVTIGWTAILLTNVFSERTMRRYRIDVEDNQQARKYVTQIRVLKRSANILIFLLTTGAVLLTFESVQRYGVSLFASAGVAGLVVGFAARPVLANLIAGVQIALTQPIRIEDAVLVEGEWGWIEEIGATYVVIRIWDWRRMIVPLSYFIEQPFQNWTRDGASIIGSVVWYLDYTVPMEAMRARLDEFVHESPYWDGQVVVLQLIDTTQDTVVLRGLMSARTSPQCWDLRCEIREKMVVWLQAEYPEALPRMRAEFRDVGEQPSGNLGTAPTFDSKAQSGER